MEATDQNTSGTGNAAIVPPQIKGWNWGAMLLNWIWGLGNSTYLALLMFVPFVNFVMFFVLGAKGNEWAWRNKRWESVEHFQRVQRRWTQASLLLLAGMVLLGFVIFKFAQGAMKDSMAYQQAAAAVATNGELAEALGTPIEPGSPQGGFSSSGGSGSAELSFDVKGPKGHGTAYAKAVQDSGIWSLTGLQVAVDGRAERIVIAGGGAKAAAAAATPAASGNGPAVTGLVLSEAKNGTDNEDSFGTDTAKIYATVALQNVGAGVKMAAVWVAVEAKDVAPGTEFARTEVDTKEETTTGNFSVGKPDSGWPPGRYRVDILADGKKLSSGKFKIE